MWDLIVSVPDHCLSFYFSDKAGWLRRFARLKEHKPHDTKVPFLMIWLNFTVLACRLTEKQRFKCDRW